MSLALPTFILACGPMPGRPLLAGRLTDDDGVGTDAQTALAYMASVITCRALARVYTKGMETLLKANLHTGPGAHGRRSGGQR